MNYFIEKSEWLEIENEQKQLELKINNLENYLKNNPERIIGEFQTSLLINQLNYMICYNNILCVRLNTLEVIK